MKVVVLGGCGEEGRKAVNELSKSKEVDGVVVADINLQKAEKIARIMGGKVSARQVDVTKTPELKEVMRGADVVMNFVGPFYKFGEAVVRTAVDVGVNYVDIMDDYDPIGSLLGDEELSSIAQKKGITVILGLGVSPGLTNILSKLGADEVDKVDEIRILWAFTSSAGAMSPAVMYHMFHITSGLVPTFQDFKWVNVKPLKDGEEIVEFPRLGKVRVFHVGHGEPVSIPRYVKGVRTVCNKFGSIPEEIVQMYRLFADLELTSEKPIDVLGHSIRPIDFISAYFKQLSPEVVAEVFRVEEVEPIFACRVEVIGERGGKKISVEYSYEASDYSPATYLPATIGAIMLGRGEIEAKGVFAPEGCLEPRSLMQEVEQRGITWTKGERVLTS
ncbi:MAG: hypothetical protein DRN06_02360 [Thermoprotei archaeon]|nr:MAG: hypothetical protein DRN06_02360 [Thermoprotei archaeon]